MGLAAPVKFILDLLFPPRCIFCRKLLKDDESGWCNDCQQGLPWIVGQNEPQKFDFISQCFSVLWYQGDVRESIHRYKFSGCSGYSEQYGRLIAQCVSDHLTGSFDYVTWVPLSKQSLKKRGYDQAKLLAVVASRELGCAAINVLVKMKNTNVQSTIKEDSARRANVLGAYDAENSTLIEGKRILLIDDVVTTGSTLSECARVLHMYGAKDVVCVTLARARKTVS